MPLPQAIAIMLIRLWAATSFVASFLNLPIRLNAYTPDNAEMIGYIAGSFAWVLVTVATWFLARPLSAIIAPRGQSTPPGAADYNDLTTVGTFLVGLYILSVRLPAAVVKAIQLINGFLQGSTTAETSGVFGKVVYFDAAELAAQWGVIAIAFFLVGRPRGIAKLVSSLRTATPSFHSRNDEPPPRE